MSAHHGRGGAVLIGSTALGEVTAWAYNETLEDTEAPAMGQTTKRYLAGLSEAGGSFGVNYDDADDEQEALDVGDEVALHLHPRGTAASRPEFTSVGNGLGDVVLITGVEVTADTGSVVSRSYTFRNALVRADQ